MEPMDTKIWEKHVDTIAYVNDKNDKYHEFNKLNNTKHGFSLQNLNQFDVSPIFGHTGDPESTQLEGPFGGGQISFLWTYQVLN